MLLWIGFPFIIVPRFLLREEQFKNWQISLNHIFERVTDIKRAAPYERKLKQKVFSTFGGLKIMLFHKLKSLSWSLTLWSDVERAFLSYENIRLRYRKLGKSKKYNLLPCHSGICRPFSTPAYLSLSLMFVHYGKHLAEYYYENFRRRKLRMYEFNVFWCKRLHQTI